MYCDKCQFQVSSTVKICPKCGNRHFVDNKDQIQKTTPQFSGGSSTSRTRISSTLSEPRPWLRFWAKVVDMSIVSFIVGFLLAYFNILHMDKIKSDFVITIVSAFFWIPAEAFCLTRWGTTPGRKLMKIKITHQSGKIDFANAVTRSFQVLFRGFGLAIPFISFICQIIAYLDLNKNKITSWDKELGFSVTHERLGMERIILILLVLAVVFYLIYLAQQPPGYYQTY